MRPERWTDKHVVDENGCWIWQGSVAHNGYGTRQYRGKHRTAHRAYYIHYKIEVPEGMHIDHLCRVKLCVNPRHLDMVTAKENMRRKPGVVPYEGKIERTYGGPSSGATECRHGHPYSPDNVGQYVGRSGKKKGFLFMYCITCQRASVNKCARKKRAAERASRDSGGS